MFLEPALVGVNGQLPFPEIKVIEQLAPAPSLTPTVPLGVPLKTGFTTTLTVTAWPTTDGFGVALTLVVVLALAMTGPATAALALPE
jgi:hypothetical protein